MWISQQEIKALYVPFGLYIANKHSDSVITSSGCEHSFSYFTISSASVSVCEKFTEPELRSIFNLSQMHQIVFTLYHNGVHYTLFQSYFTFVKNVHYVFNFIKRAFEASNCPYYDVLRGLLKTVVVRLILFIYLIMFTFAFRQLEYQSTTEKNNRHWTIEAFESGSSPIQVWTFL